MTFWNELREGLWKIEASDFEKLVAQLLQKLLGNSFIVARGGTQDSGDARSQNAGTVVQAKRYESKTRLNLPEISYDIERMAKNSEVDVYVLAATRSVDASLKTMIEEKETDTGLDVVCIDYPDGDTPRLGCLCVAFWDVLENFQPTQDLVASLKGEASSVAKEESVKEEVERLKKYLQHSLQSYDHWAAKTLNHLSLLFEDAESKTSPIILSKSVRRESAMNGIAGWWGIQSPCALVQGEEGTGKTWVAAAFAKEIAISGTIVFWFFSTAWRECRSPEDLIQRGFRALGVTTANNGLLSRLTRKALHRWKKPIFIVLDGVNERGGGEAASSVLRQLKEWRANSEDQTAEHLRILLTSRPLHLHPTFGPELSKQLPCIQATPFTDPELSQFLENHSSPVRVEKIPENVLPLVRIPRYTALCLKHLHNAPADLALTPAILMWLDLVDRIDDRSDLDVRDELGWKRPEDALEVLASIAQKFKASEAGASLSSSAIREIFPDFDSARRVLKDLRYASVSIINSKVSPEVAELAWALYILQQVRQVDGSSIPEIADNLSTEIEPLINSDIKSEAIRQAALLAIKDPSLLPSERNTLAIASLIYRWLYLNNIYFDHSTLYLLADEEWPIYISVIEQIFSELSRLTADEFLIAPLIDIIQREKDIPEDLSKLLNKWLLLCYRPELAEGQESYKYEGANLPLARNEYQLRLTSIAMSLISLRPDKQFIKALALSIATQDVSFGAPIGNEDAKPMAFKHMEKQLAFLMRWGYTDTILPELYLLDEQTDESEPLIKKGYRLLAYYLWLASTREDFCLHFPTSNWRSEYISPETALKERKRITDVPQGAGYQITKLNTAYLASRKDLPSLLQDDILYFQHHGAELIENVQGPFRGMVRMIEEDQIMESIMWLGASEPGLALKLLKISRLKMLPLAHSTRYIYSFEVPWHKRLSREESAAVAKSWQEALEENPDLENNNQAWQFELSRFAICCFETDTLIEWIIFLERRHTKKLSLNFLPCPNLLKYRQDEKLANIAREELLKINPSDWSQSEWAIVYYASWYSFDEDIVKSVSSEILSTNPNDNRIFTLWAILFAAANTKFWECIAAKPELLERIDSIASRACFFHSHVGDEEASGILNAEMLCRIPDKVFAANLINAIGDNSWMELVKAYLDLALNLIEQMPWAPNPSDRLVIELNGVGEIAYKYHKKDENEVYGYIDDKFSYNGDVVAIREEFEVEEKYKPNYEFWRGFKLTAFDSVYLLEEYANVCSEEFRDWSRLFTQKLNNTRNTTAYNYRKFQHDIILAALNIDTDLFLELETQSRGGHVNVFYEGKVPALVAEVFKRASGNSKLLEWLELRLINAKSDDDIQAIVCAGLYAENVPLVEEIATKFCGNQLAKIRCLGVSMLAILGTDTAISLLDELVAKDDSGWVREHSEWARSVALSEKSCRELYREVLNSKDDDISFVNLHRIRASLFCSSFTWRRRIEKEENFWEKGISQRKMLICAFWNRRESVSNSNEEVYGRKLKEYCRGEKLDAFASKKMAPWWP